MEAEVVVDGDRNWIKSRRACEFDVSFVVSLHRGKAIEVRFVRRGGARVQLDRSAERVFRRAPVPFVLPTNPGKSDMCLGEAWIELQCFHRRGTRFRVGRGLGLAAGKAPAEIRIRIRQPGVCRGKPRIKPDGFLKPLNALIDSFGALIQEVAAFQVGFMQLRADTRSTR